MADGTPLPDFRAWSWLAGGSTDQRRAHAVLTRDRLFDRLAPWDAALAGTFPLDIAIAGSDLDILVHAPDPDALAPLLDREFGRESDYARRLIRVADGPALVAGFTLDRLPVEIFVQAVPVDQQMAWRHMLVEARLLALHPPLRPQIRALKAAGMKTEPAFCHLLGLEGDAYATLLTLENIDNSALYHLLAGCGAAMRENG